MTALSVLLIVGGGCRHAAESGAPSAAKSTSYKLSLQPSQSTSGESAMAEPVKIPKPDEDTPVVDYAELLTADEKADMVKSLVDVSGSGIAQIVVITVKDIGNEDPLEVAKRTANEWGVGDKNTNNGITILIKPKTEASPGKVAIATGTGMEKKLSNKECQRITDSVMTPAFKQGKYADGINSAIDEIMSIVM